MAAVFGVAGRPTLPGTALVALLGDLGLAPAAARRALARMREQGQLRTTRRGRGVDHHLVGAFRASVERLRDDRGVAPVWDGAFHALLHQVPEPARAYRDRLRRAAVLVGYASWQPGVLIATTDRTAALREVLDDAPEGAAVVVGRLTVDGGAGAGGDTDAVATAAAMARRAWALDELAADLDAHRGALRAALAAPVPADGAAALHRLAHLTNAVYVDLLRDPGLSHELLPPDWPGDELRVLLGRAAEAYLPAVVAHVHARLAAAG